MSAELALFAAPKRPAAKRAPKAKVTPPKPKPGSPGPWVLTINAPTITVRSKVTGKSNPAAGWLTMNDRRYWRQKAAIAIDWKDATKVAATQVRMPVGIVRRARFDVVLRLGPTRRRDPINWHPTAKAILDALTNGTAKHPGYGFLPDDSPGFLHCSDCPHLSIGEPVERKPFGPYGQVVVTITDLPGEVTS